MTRRIIPAVISAILLVLSFPPFGLGFLAWFSLVPLLFALDGAGRGRGFLTGFVFGSVFFLGTVNWVINSMYNYGGVPFAASIGVMLLLVLYLAVYPALFGLLFSFTHVLDPVLRMTLAGAFWVTLEYARGYLFTGFPWVVLGYTQASYAPVIQIADTTGVWGVSFLIMAVNAAVYLFAGRIVRKEPARPAAAALIVSLALLSSVFIYGFMKMNQVDKEVFFWTRIRAGIAQGSIDQGVKWDLTFQDKTLDIYSSLTDDAARQGARLIIWPETAIPYYFDSGRVEKGAVGDAARKTGSFILTGSPSYGYNPGTRALEYFNSAYLLSPAGAVVGRYDKMHLVPFGEYVPLKSILPFKKLTAGVGDFASGPGPVPIALGNSGIGVLICYESIFPEISAGFMRNGAGLLVNITNDAWFGMTSAPYQHFEMSILRAVENKSYLLRAANTGISAIIDPAGRVVKRTGLFRKDLLVESVGIKNGGLTFYAANGDIFTYGLIVFSGIFVISRLIKRR